MKTALITVLLLGAFAAAKPAETNTASSAATISRERCWREDLDSFARELPARHLDFFTLISKKKFDQEIRQLESELPRLSDGEIVFRLMRLAARVGVGHTRVSWPAGALAFRNYPLGFYWFSDGLAIAAATPEYREAVGARVLRIGSQTPQQVQAAVAPFISHDNEAGLRGESPVFMRVAELLQYLRIADAKGQVRLQLAKPDGSHLLLQVAAAPAETQTNWIKIWDAWAVPRRLSGKRVDAFYWYELLPGTRTLYIQYNVCANTPGNPFESFVQGMFAFADTQAVERVVVDLRGNGGGDSRVVKPLLDGLKSRGALSARGHLYALIGRGTCSSGMMAAEDLRRELHAILVGEPTGGKPNAYGDVRTFRLPNSQMEIRYSTIRFHRMPKGDPPSLKPDFFVPQSLSDSLAGHDPVVEAALRHRLK
jgi:hypothetical protein